MRIKTLKYVNTTQALFQSAKAVASEHKKFEDKVL